MIAVIFELQPLPGKGGAYLEQAAALREVLEDFPGFLSIERFESLSVSGKILSLSFFKDEEALARWRTLAAHRAAQTLGRDHLFQDYRLRVAHVMRDYGMTRREEAPADSRTVHDQGSS